MLGLPLSLLGGTRTVVIAREVGTLTLQLLQRALFPHIPVAARNHGCRPMLCLVLVNSSDLQHHCGPVQRTLKRSKSNVRDPVSSVVHL